MLIPDQSQEFERAAQEGAPIAWQRFGNIVQSMVCGGLVGYLASETLPVPVRMAAGAATAVINFTAGEVLIRRQFNNQ